jgi:hypothetical protein
MKKLMDFLMAAMSKTASAVAVGSGALLGCWSMDKIINAGLLMSACVGMVMALGTLAVISMTEISEYLDKVKKRDKRQNDRQSDKPSRVSLHLLCRLRLLFGYANLKRYLTWRKIYQPPNGIQMADKTLKIPGRFGIKKLLDLLCLFGRNLSLRIGKLCGFFGCHKSNERKQPNVQSSGTRDQPA